MPRRVLKQAITATLTLAIPALSAGHAVAESYFCTPKPVKIGSYQPEDASSELDIRVAVPDAYAFWFDDKNGDFVSDKDSVVRPLEHGRVKLPLLSPTKDDISSMAFFAFTARQCVPAPLGVVPSSQQTSP